jgi:predicted branched-subunit amino acid permease
MPQAPTITPSVEARILWIFITVLAALVVALAAGILRKSSGVRTSEAIIFGGKAFAGAATLILLIAEQGKLL